MSDILAPAGISTIFYFFYSTLIVLKKLVKKKLVATLSKVNSQSQFDNIDTSFVFFCHCRDRDVRSLDIFDEKAHPLTVRKVP